VKQHYRVAAARDYIVEAHFADRSRAVFKNRFVDHAPLAGGMDFMDFPSPENELLRILVSSSAQIVISVPDPLKSRPR
jgi:hypothetical protein